MRNPLTALFAAPVFRRIGFHAKRIGGQLDRHFFTSLLAAIFAFVLVAAIAVTLLEPERFTLGGVGSSFYWAITTVIGSGDASYVTSPGGFVVGWLLAFFGVAIVAAMTGAVVGFVIDFLLKEGQGMGAAGYRDHIVVCGWNTTARDLIQELKGDEFTTKVVLLHDAERNPAGDGVYYVRGDITNTDDLERSGIREATSAIVFPTDRSDEADMRSILTVMAIESIAPGGAHSGRGEQPGPPRALPPCRCRRDPRHLAPRLTPAGAIGAVSGAQRAGHRYRLRRPGLGAVPGRAAGRRTSACRSTSCRRSSAASTAPRCWPSPAAARA